MYVEPTSQFMSSVLSSPVSSIFTLFCLILCMFYFTIVIRYFRVSASVFPSFIRSLQLNIHFIHKPFPPYRPAACWYPLDCLHRLFDLFTQWFSFYFFLSKYSNQPGVCVCVRVRVCVSCEVHALDIWHADSSWLYLCKIRRSRSWVKVHGHRMKMFLFLLPDPSYEMTYSMEAR